MVTPKPRKPNPPSPPSLRGNGGFKASLPLGERFGEGLFGKVLASVETLKKRYTQEREMSRIPIVINGEIKTLSPGGQNILIEKIINDFNGEYLLQSY